MKKLFSVFVLGCAGLQPLYADELSDAVAKHQQACDKEDASSCNELGVAYYKKGKYSEAETFIQKGLEIRTKNLGDENDTVALSLNNLAVVYQAQGKYQQANELFEKSLIMSKKLAEKKFGQNHLSFAESLNELAMFYWGHGKYEQARQLYEQSLEIKENILGSEHLEVAKNLNNLALVYDEQNQYELAESLYQRSLIVQEKALGKDHPEVTVALNNLASSYRDQGKYQQAEVLYQRSLAIHEKNANKDLFRLSMTLGHLGVLYAIQAKYEQAEPLLQRCLKIEEQIFSKNDPHIASSLVSLAELYQAQGKYELAEPLLLRGLASLEKVLGKNHPDVANSLQKLADLYSDQGKYAEAEFLVQRSLTINEKVFGENHPSIARDLNHLAVIYGRQGRFEKAEPLLQRSLAIKEKTLGENHPEIANTLDNLAAFYKGTSEQAQVEPLIVRSLEIRKNAFGENHPYVAGSLRRLAGVYEIKGDYAEAENLLQRSLAIIEKTFDKTHPSVVHELGALVHIYLVQNKYEQATAIFERSLRLTNRNLEHWLWGAGEKTRQSYLQKEEYARDAYLSFYSFLHLSEEAFYFSLSRKGLLLRISSEINVLTKQSNNPEVQKQAAEFNSLKAQLASLSFSDKPEDRGKTKDLEEQANNLERELTQKIATFKRTKTNVSPQEVLDKLESDQAMVDFLVYKERDLKTNKEKTEQAIVLVADKKQGIKLIKLGELAPISETIKTYRQTILPTPQGQLANREDVLKPASQKLYQLIWQPLLPHIANKKQIYLVPDGILNLFPFKALQDEKGHYLAEKQQITLLSSARDIVLPPLEAKTNDAAIFAAPVFGNKDDKTSNITTRSVVKNRQDVNFEPLDGAELEGKTLSNLIKPKQPIQLFQGQQASEAEVAKMKSPRFLHFATHGFFLEILPPAPENPAMHGLMQEDTKKNQLIENPLTRSGLALTGANFGIKGQKQADGTDGILTALEVLGLNLEGTDLVTLSACETGVGDIQVGEGVYSLNRAFQEAGAKNVLSTLWSVADEQTQQFMQNFYTLVLNGKTPQQALQETQLKFINNKTLKDPFFWAAFTVVGI